MIAELCARLHTSVLPCSLCLQTHAVSMHVLYASSTNVQEILTHVKEDNSLKEMSGLCSILLSRRYYVVIQ